MTLEEKWAEFSRGFDLAGDVTLSREELFLRLRRAFFAGALIAVMRANDRTGADVAELRRIIAEAPPR